MSDLAAEVRNGGISPEKQAILDAGEQRSLADAFNTGRKGKGWMKWGALGLGALAVGSFLTLGPLAAPIAALSAKLGLAAATLGSGIMTGLKSVGILGLTGVAAGAGMSGLSAVGKGMARS